MCTWLANMLVLSLLVLTAGLTLAYEEYDLNQAESLFEDFIQKYNKVYGDDQEKQMRFNIFKETLNEINEQNKEHGYNVMGINEFTDLSIEEFESIYLGYVPKEKDNQYAPPSKILKTSSEGIPENFDWREKGVINKVTSQGHCGSGWAFSIISNVESQYAIKHGADKLIKLSEQQLVDCDKHDNACQGGDILSGFFYIKQQGGVMTRDDYPYVSGVTPSRFECKFNQSLVKVKVKVGVDFPDTPEERIKSILVNYGPLSLALAGAPLKQYEKGVFKACKADAKISHGVLLVGYGTDEETKQPYWLIRNSWSSMWGESGYIRIIRDNPDCFIGKYDLILTEVA